MKVVQESGSAQMLLLITDTSQSNSLLGGGEERTLVRDVRLSLRARKIAAPARVPHPGEPDRSRAKSFPLVSSPAYLDLLQMWAMVMHIPRYT